MLACTFHNYNLSTMHLLDVDSVKHLSIVRKFYNYDFLMLIINFYVARVYNGFSRNFLLLGNS